MSLKFLVSNVHTLHGPGIDGQLPHHVPAFFDGRVAQIVFFALIGKFRFALKVAVRIGHTSILPFSMGVRRQLPPSMGSRIEAHDGRNGQAIAEKPLQ